MNRIRKAKEHRYEKQILQRLVKKKLIVIQEAGETLRAALTQTGENELFRLQIIHAPRCLDGQICMVVFDIPESKKQLRKNLRDFLRYASFTPLQKSVWISARDATTPLSRLFASKKLSRWISVFRAEKIN